MNKRVIRTDDEHEMGRLAHLRGRPVIVCRKEEGWPLSSNDPGLQLCWKGTGQRSHPVCNAVAVWKRVQRGQGSISTGYYCDEHLGVEIEQPERKGN